MLNASQEVQQMTFQNRLAEFQISSTNMLPFESVLVHKGLISIVSKFALEPNETYPCCKSQQILKDLQVFTVSVFARLNDNICF